jgi:flagellar hook assembly protein FlgD
MHLSVNPNPAEPQATIDFQIPESKPGLMAQIIIYRTEGNIIRRLFSPVQGECNRTVWDGRNESGQPVPSGTYIVKVRAAGGVMMRAFAI